MHLKYVALIFLSISTSFSDSRGDEGCPSTQYVNVGTTEVINCYFERFFALLWYNSTNVLHDEAVAVLQESVKSGIGYKSREFDVYPNGSLIINNVTMEHKATFTVLKFETQTSPPSRYIIIIVPLATSFSDFPVVTQCGNAGEVCMLDWNRHTEVTCSIRDAPSMVSLSWFVRTIDTDKIISSHLTLTNRSSLYTSSVTVTDPFVYSSLLALLVCKAENPSGLLNRNESLIFLLNNSTDWTSPVPVRKYLELGSRLYLNCRKMSHIVWQIMERSKETFDNILYAAFTESVVVNHSDGDYDLESTGSLVVDAVSVRHEGLYRCISTDGMADDIILYDIFITISPSPKLPIIEGCNHENYCVIEAQGEGSITCTLKKIRPSVHLDLKTFFEESSQLIHIYDKHLTISGYGDTSDVTLTSRYRVKDTQEKRITLECKVVGEYAEQFDLSTKFDVLVPNDVLKPTQDNVYPSDQTQSARPNYWIILVPLAIFVLILVLCATVIMKVRWKRQYRNKKQTDGEGAETVSTAIKGVELEEVPARRKSNGYEGPEEEVTLLISEEDRFQINKQNFITELKSKYEVLYDAVQPIPYIRDRLYCINKVYVEGGIEYFVKMDMIGGHGSWEKLETYQNIFSDPRVKSTRRILEGEPGYGKSTLTLQFAYDWCNKNNASSLSEVDIFILLRLRQLGGVKSIYRAIKQFLLPKDSRLTEGDIEVIMRDNSSVVIVLDGFDEYPDQDGGSDSDVINIIQKNMFQQYEVIITSRSSCLPKEFPPQTKRIKLTGFDDRARDQYIRKAVVSDDEGAVERLKERLKDNPVLAGLCQVPLFFVMFAHMSHEIKDFEKSYSVTSFFRYMISSFHSHMKNKMKDENVEKYELYETNHQKLDKIAFEGLSGGDQKIVWKKQKFCEQLEQDFYNQYVRIGILVEEEVLAITDDPSCLVSEHIKYEKEVRFYHKLFCEWYAAHHLAEYASKDGVMFEDSFEYHELSENGKRSRKISKENSNYQLLTGDDSAITQERNVLKNLDPLELQYLYRFTCGLNPHAGEKIIKYLQRKEDGNKFAILCILEQEGKIENLLEIIQKLCSSEVEIKSEDSLLLQRSTIQLLKIASSKEVPISMLKVVYCFHSVVLEDESLYLSSGFKLPKLDTLQELVIYGCIDLRETAAGILDYSAKCVALKILKFTHYGNRRDIILLPQTLADQDICSKLLRKQCKVQWVYNFLVDAILKKFSWRLNLNSGNWEDERGNEMTSKDYLRVVEKF